MSGRWDCSNKTSHFILKTQVVLVTLQDTTPRALTKEVSHTIERIEVAITPTIIQAVNNGKTGTTVFPVCLAGRMVGELVVITTAPTYTATWPMPRLTRLWVWVADWVALPTRLVAMVKRWALPCPVDLAGVVMVALAATTEDQVMEPLIIDSDGCDIPCVTTKDITKPSYTFYRLLITPDNVQHSLNHSAVHLSICLVKLSCTLPLRVYMSLLFIHYIIIHSHYLRHDVRGLWPPEFRSVSVLYDVRCIFRDQYCEALISVSNYNINLVLRKFI